MVLGYLNHIKENNKFQIDAEEGKIPKDSIKGIHHMVQIVEEKYNLKYVYVRHAITCVKFCNFLGFLMLSC